MNLAARKDIETLRLQLSKVEPKDAIIPIIFSGNRLLTSKILNLNTY